MKLMTMILCLVVSASAHASSIVWGIFGDSNYYDYGGRTGMEYDFAGKHLYVSLFFETQSSGSQLSMVNPMCNLATAITWTPMSHGDLVDSSVFGEGKVSLYSTEYTGWTGSLAAEIGSEFYLAFQAFELLDDDPSVVGDLYLGNAYYGWVGFSATEEGSFDLMSSAINIDGGPILAGGGAVPEPSSFSLLAIGLAGLALRRRRG